MSRLLVSFNKFQTMDDTISPTKLPAGHLPYVVNYTYDELFALKKIGGNIEAQFGSYVSSAPEEVTMVDAYWYGGSVYNTSVLKETFAMKWPSAATAIPTTTPVYMQLSITTTANGGGYVGKMYRATTTWDESSASAPTPSSDYIDINCPSNNTQYTFDIPLSWYSAWYDGDYDTNFGVVVVGTGGEFHSSAGVLGYGTGAQGDITISSDTSIETLVDGYDPEHDIYINATNFTINAGKTLTCLAWGDGTDNKKGIIYIMCQGAFTNNGTINCEGMGGRCGQYAGASGVGSGKGQYLSGGVSYGSKEIPTTTWANIYGSGGGGPGVGAGPAGVPGGGAGHKVAGTNNGTVNSFWDGASIVCDINGGGAVRIYAATIDTSNGVINCNANTPAAQPTWLRPGNSSGGTCYLEARQSVILGNNKVTATKSTYGYASGVSSDGRVYVVSPIISGTTTPNYETNS